GADALGQLLLGPADPDVDGKALAQEVDAALGDRLGDEHPDVRGTQRGAHGSASAKTRWAARSPSPASTGWPSASSARSSAATTASPGGVISPFCEAATTTSTPKRSIGRSRTPTEETASSTSSRSPQARRRAGTSATAPVEVSQWVVNTTSIAGSSA